MIQCLDATASRTHLGCCLSREKHGENKMRSSKTSRYISESDTFAHFSYMSTYC